MTTATATTQSAWLWRGQSIHYVQVGHRPDRPPLLLVHGFGASTDHWRKNIEGLANEFEVWAIDLLGFGRSAKPAWEYSGALWEAQIQDFIAQKVGRSAVLAGNSLGGYACLCVAANHPKSVVGAVLLNSAGPFSNRQVKPKSGFQAAISQVVRIVMLQPLPSWLLFQHVRRKAVIRRTLEKVYVDRSAITEELIEDIRRPAFDPGAAQVFASVFKAPQGDSVDALLHRMSCPLLLLWGEGDPWMNCRDRGALFRAHYQTLQEHYLQAGHCPHDEVPEQVNHLIRDWMLQLN